ARRARGRRPRDERRLRLFGRELDRVRLPARRAGRAGPDCRGGDLRRMGCGRGRGRGALRPGRGAKPRVVDAIVERVWPGGVDSVEALGGGITNHNFKVSFGSETFVLRIGGKDTELLGIDRGAEYEASQMAARLGIGPPVVTFLQPEGYLVTR